MKPRYNPESGRKYSAYKIANEYNISHTMVYKIWKQKKKNVDKIVEQAKGLSNTVENRNINQKYIPKYKPKAKAQRYSKQQSKIKHDPIYPTSIDALLSMLEQLYKHNPEHPHVEYLIQGLTQARKPYRSTIMRLFETINDFNRIFNPIK